MSHHPTRRSHLLLPGLALALVLSGDTRLRAAPPAPISPAAKAAADLLSTIRDTAPSFDPAPEQSEYRSRIDALLRRPSRQIEASLVQVSQGSGADAALARIMEIALARVREPRRFLEVEPYLEPAPDNPFADLLPKPREWVSVPLAPMKPFTLALLHSDYLAAATKYPQAFSAVRAIYDRIRDQARASTDRGDKVHEQLRAELLDALARLQEQMSIPRDEFGLLVEAAGVWLPRLPRLNPDYRLAWEEALLRPTSWPVKMNLARIVASFNDSASAPALGETIRLALRVTTPADHPGALDLLIYDSLDALAKHADASSLVEMHAIIAQCTGEKRDIMERAVGGRIARSPAWQTLLAAPADDGRSTEALKKMRDAVAAYQLAAQR